MAKDTAKTGIISLSQVDNNKAKAENGNQNKFKGKTTLDFGQEEAISHISEINTIDELQKFAPDLDGRKSVDDALKARVQTIVGPKTLGPNSGEIKENEVKKSEPSGEKSVNVPNLSVPDLNSSKS